MKLLDTKKSLLVHGGNADVTMGIVVAASAVGALLGYGFGQSHASNLMSGDIQAAKQELSYLVAKGNALQNQAKALIDQLKPTAPIAVTQIK